MTSRRTIVLASTMTGLLVAGLVAAAGELLMCAFDSITLSWRWRLVQG